MSYSARAFHFQSAVNHIVDDLLDTLPFYWVISIVHDARVEVSIADMSKNASKQAQPVKLLLGDF